MDQSEDPGGLEDVLVVVAHPHGDIEVPLAIWIATGPGPRPYVRPVSARSRSTGRPLPLTVIPLRYRNDPEARQAIRDGLVENPWPGTAYPPADEPDQSDQPDQPDQPPG